MPGQPSVFVGASGEADEHEHMVREILEAEGLRPVPWRGSFLPGEYGLDSLSRLAESCDGAVLIASADDRTWYRGQESFSPRDNVIFELGFFLRAFGRSNTLVVLVNNAAGESPRVPTDLTGLTTVAFEPGKDAKNTAALRDWARAFLGEHRPFSPEAQQLLTTLLGPYRQLDGEKEDLIRRLIVQPFRHALDQALRGEIMLTPGQYYNLLDQEISSAGAQTNVLAVSTVTSQVWNADRDQQDYFRQNLAAAARGAQIRRLFILPTRLQMAMEQIIQEQDHVGIDVRVARPEFSADIGTLEDIVVFASDHFRSARGYVALPSFDNPGRIRGGKLLLDRGQLLRQRELFESAWAIAADPDARRIDVLDGLSARPPGEKLTPQWLERPVVSCEEAALARGVPLHSELKSLVLQTGTGTLVVHIPGDENLSLRAVKSAIEVENVSLASLEALHEMRLGPGTVSAVLEPVWSMPHIVDRAVLAMDTMTTNNGVANGYFQFDPKILLKAPSVIVADIIDHERNAG